MTHAEWGGHVLPASSVHDSESGVSLPSVVVLPHHVLGHTGDFLCLCLHTPPPDRQPQVLSGHTQTSSPPGLFWAAFWHFLLPGFLLSHPFQQRLRPLSSVHSRACSGLWLFLARGTAQATDPWAHHSKSAPSLCPPSPPHAWPHLSLLTVTRCCSPEAASVVWFAGLTCSAGPLAAGPLMLW